jgi:hypothetical protein
MTRFVIFSENCYAIKLLVMLETGSTKDFHHYLPVGPIEENHLQPLPKILMRFF